MTKQAMKQLFAFTLVQCTIVLALVLSRPFYPPETNTSSHARTMPERGLAPLQQPESLSGGAHSSASATSRAARRIDDGYEFKPALQLTGPSLSPPAQAPANSERYSKVGKTHPSRNELTTKFNQNERLEPTLEQVEQTLSVPLALFDPPADAGLTAAQTGDVAAVAAQFVNAVEVANQDPADPAYAGRYDEARALADEQVWAVSGQDTYTALIDARAQAAGNPPVGP